MALLQALRQGRWQQDKCVSGPALRSCLQPCTLATWQLSFGYTRRQPLLQLFPPCPTCSRSASSTRSMPEAPSASSSSMRSLLVVKVGTTSSPAGLLQGRQSASEAA